jgi:hypothetical protein
MLKGIARHQRFEAWMFSWGLQMLVAFDVVMGTLYWLATTRYENPHMPLWQLSLYGLGYFSLSLILTAFQMALWRIFKRSGSAVLRMPLFLVGVVLCLIDTYMDSEIPTMIFYGMSDVNSLWPHGKFSLAWLLTKIIVAVVCGGSEALSAIMTNSAMLPVNLDSMSGNDPRDADIAREMDRLRAELDRMRQEIESGQTGRGAEAPSAPPPPSGGPNVFRVDAKTARKLYDTGSFPVIDANQNDPNLGDA